MPRRPIYQTETTGNYWVDVREAFKVTPSSTYSTLFKNSSSFLLFSSLRAGPYANAIDMNLIKN
jgi:hypothetical protein